MRTLLSCLLLLTCALSFADGYRDDDRLAKPITMRLKIAPFSTFVAQLGKATGVGIFVAPNIADRKITAIFKDRRAADAMAMVEKTFFCEWTKESAGYRLVMPRANLKEESDQLAAEQAYLKARVAEVVAELTALGSRSKEELIEIRDRMKLEMDKLRPLTDPASKKQYATLKAESAKFRWLGNWDIGFALQGARGASDTLAAGSLLFTSTKRGEALPLPTSCIPIFKANVLIPSPDGGEPKAEIRSPNGAIAALRCNTITGNLDWKVLATGLGPGGSGGTGYSIPILNSGEADAALAGTALRTRIRAWVGFLDTDILASKIDRSKVSAPSPGYLAKQFSIAEHLEFIADTSGVPVMADAFRLPASNESFMNSQTVGEYVRELLSQTEPGVQGGSFRSEGGWLMFKHPRYWRRQGAEIAEGLFEAMERKSSWALNDYVKFAAALTPLQAQVFPTVPSLTRFPRIPLIKGIPAFRVWGNLSADQQRQAYGPGLPYAALSSVQKGLYTDAVMGMFWQYGLSEIFFPLLLRGGDPGDQLGLLMQDGGNGGGPAMDLDREDMVRDGAPQQFTMESMKALIPRSVSFMFGSGPLAGTSYNILLPPSPN